MNRKLATIIALQAFIIIMLFWMLVFYGRDEYEAFVQGEIEEEIETPSRVSNEQGMSVVTLPQAAQEQSGITTARLEENHHTSALSTYGAVVNIDKLLEQRSRYLTAMAEAGIARASLVNTQQEFNRLTTLNQDNRNVSDRAVANAEALLKADQAKLNAAESIARNLRDNMRQQWGDTLATQATQTSANSAVMRILQQQDVLIQVTLPFGTPSPANDSSILVAPSGSTAKTLRAHFISTSPQADAAVQGETYYYRAPADSLRVGMRVSVSMNGNQTSEQGVTVPRSAIVWYGGQTWVYRKSDDARFLRIPVSTTQETDGGWFNSNGLQSGDEIVVTGAQLLLSEEFKYQITNENDD
jgi:multidrug efflux system membrane fusion protein